MVSNKKVKVHWELVVRIGKGVATNENGLGIELESKKFKVRLSEIRVVVCAKKMARPWMEKSYFFCMNLSFMSRLGKGDLDHRAWSNTICLSICNLRVALWSKPLAKIRSEFRRWNKWWLNKGDFMEDAKWMHRVKTKDTPSKTSSDENTKT